MIAVVEARTRAAAAVSAALPAEDVAIGDALGRVLAEDAAADRDDPPFDRATMDGWAVRSADTVAAPAVVRCIGDAPAGRPFAGRVGAFETVRVLTGAPLPDGADAVAPQEIAERAGERVRVAEAVAPGANVARRGENVRAGAIVARAGVRIGPAALGALATAGAARVRVGRRPRVGLLVTGDELVPPGAPAPPGTVRDSNTHLLRALIARTGCEPVPLGVVGDDEDALRERLRGARGLDAVVVTGGVSVGDRDYVPAAFRAEGVETVFHGVAVKPGKPTLFGLRDGRAWFGLPGNPASVLVAFELFVAPLLRRLEGERDPEPREATARYAGTTERSISREAYLPVRLRTTDDGMLEADPVAWRGSGDLFAHARADGLARIPAGTRIAAAGAPVCVLLVGGGWRT